MEAKKKYGTKSKASLKKTVYHVRLVKPEYGVDIKFDKAGTFGTKEEAEAYIAANPGWPHLQVKEG